MYDTADELFTLEQEIAAAKNAAAKLVKENCPALDDQARQALAEAMHDYIDDQYYPFVSPLQADIDEAASMAAHLQRQSDIADFNARVL